MFYPTIPLADLGSEKLAELGEDLTFEAHKKGKFTPVYGREKEIRQITEILRRRVKRNPVLIGEAGVGKTAIVEALALRIVQRKVPDWLEEKKIIAISLLDIIAQPDNYAFGEYAQRLKDVVNELRPQDWESEGWGRIAFFDEIHTIKDYHHGANFLKQHLARGEIQIIGATTRDEYRQYIERDPALERRFAPVFIEEPTTETTIQILMGCKSSLEKNYQVDITDSAVKLAVELSHRYIYNRQQPDKSIELLDRACVRVLTTVSNQPNLLLNPESLDEGILGRGATESPIPPMVQEQHIRTIVSEWTGIPDSSLSGERQKYLELENELRKFVIGQNTAIRQISKTIIANKAGTVTKPERPNGVFLFVGSTGIGKTELAKALAIALTGKEEHLVILDMTGYQDSYTIASLIGTPTSSNYSTPELPALTKLVRNHPFGVLLLDEIEKAHPDIWSLFMPVFEEGTLVDKQGSTIHFSDMIIIMTANVYVDIKRKVEPRFDKEKSLTINQNKNPSQLWREIYRDECLKLVYSELKFSKEFLNRIDEIVVFYPLAEKSIESIFKIQINKIEQRLGFAIDFTPRAFEFLIKMAFKSEFGARELRRVIDNYLGSELALMKLNNEPDIWQKLSKVIVDLNSTGNTLYLKPQFNLRSQE
jgi:ATP-dependent Clp protease ATP-binding subunit ClpC